MTQFNVGATNAANGVIASSGIKSNKFEETVGTIKFPQTNQRGKEAAEVKADIKNVLEKYADVAEFNWKMIDDNQIVLKNSKGATYGELKKMFHLPNKVLLGANVPIELRDAKTNYDNVVPDRPVIIPISQIGKMSGGEELYSDYRLKPEETKGMLDKAKAEYQQNVDKAKNFISTKNQLISFNEPEFDKKGPYILINGDGITPLKVYKTNLSLPDGVIKKDNEFHSPDLDEYTPKSGEQVKVYVKDIAKIGANAGEIEKLVK